MNSKLREGKYILFWLGSRQTVDIFHSASGETVFVTPTKMIHPIEDAAGAEFFPVHQNAHCEDREIQRGLLNHPAIKQKGIDPMLFWCAVIVAIVGWVTVFFLSAIAR